MLAAKRVGLFCKAILAPFKLIQLSKDSGEATISQKQYKKKHPWNSNNNITL